MDLWRVQLACGWVPHPATWRGAKISRAYVQCRFLTGESRAWWFSHSTEEPPSCSSSSGLRQGYPVLILSQLWMNARTFPATFFPGTFVPETLTPQTEPKFGRSKIVENPVTP